MNYFSKKLIEKNLYRGNFGLEKESLRIDENAGMSHVPHPFSGNRNIDRDFCENQVELITDVFKDVDDLYDSIKELHSNVVKKLYSLESGREYLWPFSNPPYVKDDDDIPVAVFDSSLESKNEYRRYLEKKYGKRKMLYSGIHFNFSFPGDMLRSQMKKYGMDSLEEFKNMVYLNLAVLSTKFSWVIVYLTAASPVRDASIFDPSRLGEDLSGDYDSPRCSEIGYWNDFEPVLDYSNLPDYIESIEDYVKKGCLDQPAELYYPVRLKPEGLNSMDNLKEKGINHIEIRTIDLNPLLKWGIELLDIEFIYLMLLYFSSFDAGKFDETEQINAIRNVKSAAKHDDGNLKIVVEGKEINIRNACQDFLDAMNGFYGEMGCKRALKAIDFQKKKLQGRRYCEDVLERFSDGFVKKGLELIGEYSREIVG